eukprot:6188707-Pleurochrysis_carterae.AAC.1
MAPNKRGRARLQLLLNHFNKHLASPTADKRVEQRHTRSRTNLHVDWPQRRRAELASASVLLAPSPCLPARPTPAFPQGPSGVRNARARAPARRPLAPWRRRRSPRARQRI